MGDYDAGTAVVSESEEASVLTAQEPVRVANGDRILSDSDSESLAPATTLPPADVWSSDDDDDVSMVGSAGPAQRATNHAQLRRRAVAGNAAAPAGVGDTQMVLDDARQQGYKKMTASDVVKAFFVTGAVFTVLYTSMVYNLGDACLAQSPGWHGWYSFWSFFVNYMPNLMLLQVPSALGNVIAVVLVTDRQHLMGGPNKAVLPRYTLLRIGLLLVPRLVAQVAIKHTFEPKTAGGVLMVANVVATVLTPLLWVDYPLSRHVGVSLPVIWIYLVFGLLCFLVLPKCLTLDATQTARYLLNPFIIGGLEMVTVLGLHVAMKIAEEWDCENISVWARIIAASFMGFKLAVVANPLASPTMAAAVCWAMLVAEVIDRNIVAPVFPRFANPLAPKPHRPTSLHSTYIASKVCCLHDGVRTRMHCVLTFVWMVVTVEQKDCIVAPLVAVLAMMITQTSPFAELKDCRAGGVLLEGANISYARLAMFAVTLVAMEVVPPLVARLLRAVGFISAEVAAHHTFGGLTVMMPPHAIQVHLLYIAEAACILFALGQALVLSPA